MDILSYIAIAVIAYLLGSISSGILISKLFGGPNLREVGSGNTGATNALRTMGLKGGLLVFLCDILKSLTACIIGRIWKGLDGAMLAGLFAVVGHNWPCFFQFKGGKGVSSTLSAMLITFPIPAICSYLVGAGIIALTKYVSLGSIVVISLFTVVVILTNLSNWKAIIWVLIMAGLLIWRHKENIKRLLNGTERKLGEKKN